MIVFVDVGPTYWSVAISLFPVELQSTCLFFELVSKTVEHSLRKRDHLRPCVRQVEYDIQNCLNIVFFFVCFLRRSSVDRLRCKQVRHAPHQGRFHQEVVPQACSMGRELERRTVRRTRRCRQRTRRHHYRSVRRRRHRFQRNWKR